MNQGGGGSKEIGKFIASLKAQIYQCPRCRLMKHEDSLLRQAAEEQAAEENEAAGEQATDEQRTVEDLQIQIEPESEHKIEPEIEPYMKPEVEPEIGINEKPRNDLAKYEEYFKLTSEQEKILNSIFASKN